MGPTIHGWIRGPWTFASLKKVVSLSSTIHTVDFGHVTGASLLGCPVGSDRING